MTASQNAWRGALSIAVGMETIPVPVGGPGTPRWFTVGDGPAAIALLWLTGAAYPGLVLPQPAGRAAGG